MGRYIIKRLLWLIPILLGVTILIFSILYFVPGDPVQIILGDGATPETAEALREELGLNDPFVVQLGRYMYQVFLRFDFGTSYTSGISVAGELINRMPYTILIGIAGMALSMVVGIPLGIVAAVNRNSWGDRICMIIALIGVSMPSFWFALMLILLFALQLGWLPALGIGGIEYYIMPDVPLLHAGGHPFRLYDHRARQGPHRKRSPVQTRPAECADSDYYFQRLQAGPSVWRLHRH